MSEIIENLPDRVCESFQDRTILLTGGTGFLGKVIIERLLRQFDVKRIYLLIRPKENKDLHTRLNNIISSPLFDSVQNLKGEHIFEKCIPISGDLTLPNMNISPEEYMKLQKEVEFVIHSAATVRFDDPLKISVMINTWGSRRMLDLAKKMEKLQVFVHVSTTYCHPEEKVLYEKAYESPAPPQKIMDLVDWMTEDQLIAMTPALLGAMPNTYAFSKALAEDLVAAEMDNLPVIIVRPSIVIPIFKEPIPGWTDNLNGPTGILMGAAKGVIRTMYGNKDGKADFVSVDGVADATFCAITQSVVDGYKNAKKIFNCCTSNELIITWGEVIEMGKELSKESMPFDLVLWMPGGKIRSSKITHTLALIFYQLLPALIVDGLAYCFGYKPFLWKIQKRICKGLNILNYYTCNEWIFNNDNLLSLRTWLNKKEVARYIINPSEIDIMDYFIQCAYATRRYILKDPDENLPKARRTMKIMIWLDRVCNVLIKLLMAYLFYKILIWVLF